MKTIKNIQVSPDLVGSLATIFYEDGTKLSVTVNIPKGCPLSPVYILMAVEAQLGLPNGFLCGPVGPFIDEVKKLVPSRLNPSPVLPIV